MKILLVGSANSIHIVRWANALSERGNEVHVAACANDVPGDYAKYAAAVKIHTLKHPAPLGYYFNACELKKFAKRGAFDIINVHYASGYGTLGRMAGLKSAMLNVWGSDVYTYPYQSKFNMLNVRRNLLYYNALASTSNCMARQTKKLVPKYKKEIFITPFGVDTECFKPLEGIRPEDKIIFGTVKTLKPLYGIADSIRAFIKLVARLKEEGKSDLADKLAYEIYGSGPQRDELQVLIDENGMSDKIKLCGYVRNDQLPEIYNRFTVCNVNSHAESFGVAAVEAMACGVPVQVSAAEGLAEVVEDGQTGLIAPVGDIDAITDNMYKLLMDENLRKAMSIKGIERVKEFYDWNDSVENMISIYIKLIKH